MTIIDEIAEEARHVLQVQHFRLEPGDVLAFVVSPQAGRLAKHRADDLRERLRAHVPEGVEVAVVYGSSFAVLQHDEAPEE